MEGGLIRKSRRLIREGVVTATVLASKVGVSRMTMHNWLNTEAGINYKNYKKLAKVVRSLTI